MLAALLLAGALVAPSCEEVCVEGCDATKGVCYTLVLKYVVNEAMPGQAPSYSTRETFTEQNFSTIERAQCFARKIRRNGYVVSGTYSNDSNIMPEQITPMPVI